MPTQPTRQRLVSVLLVLAAAVAVTSTATGCRRLRQRAEEKAEEKLIEKQTGGQVEVDEKKGTLRIVTDAGAVTMGTGAQLPDDFPKAVPVYPGAKTQFSAKSKDPHGKDAWSVQLETGDTKDKVVAYYKANMSGFTQATSMDMGQSSMQVWQSPKLDVTLILSSEGDAKTAITLNAASK